MGYCCQAAAPAPAAAAAAILMDEARKALLTSLDSLLEVNHIFRTRPGMQPQELWLPVAFHLNVNYPKTDNSKWTWLTHAGDPFVCHSVYTQQVICYNLQVPTKRKNRQDIPARGIDIEREACMNDVREARKEETGRGGVQAS